MESPEDSDDDVKMVNALRKRDGRFVWRLLLRLAAVSLLVVWMLLSDHGQSVGRWAADGFGTFTGR